MKAYIQNFRNKIRNIIHEQAKTTTKKESPPKRSQKTIFECKRSIIHSFRKQCLFFVCVFVFLFFPHLQSPIRLPLSAYCLFFLFFFVFTIAALKICRLFALSLNRLSLSHSIAYSLNRLVTWSLGHLIA
mgnify:CR=1 FL=1